jgi:LEA14-like dessication related protein
MTRSSTYRSPAVIVGILFLGIFSQLSAQSCSELFISEYIEGSGFNKCIEIYNPTGSSIDLSNYSIRLYSNGSATISQEFTMSGMVAAGDVHVVCNPNAGMTFLDEADETDGSAINWNGDDAVALAMSGTNIDVIGQIGVDPGSEWSGGGVGTQNETLVRMASVDVGDGDGSDAFDPSLEWNSFPEDDMTDLGMNTNNCTMMPPPPPMPCSELFISEYIEGSGFNKCIEIYNPTGSSIDMSNYSIRLYSNGSATISQEFTMSGMVAAGDVHVVCNPNAGMTFLDEADETDGSAINWNGDDAVALAMSGTNIDVIGQIGVDPGSEWNTGGVGTANETLVRMTSVEAGDGDGTDAFDPSLEWTSFAQNDIADLGSHSSTCPGPPVMTPCSELFISEYIEGSSNDKCIEIYNGTGATVDLSTYVVNIYFNGNMSAGQTIPLSGMLAFGDVFIVCNNSASAPLMMEADLTTGSLNFNGDDAVELVNGMATVDVIGQIGVDPGSEWGSGDQSTQNNTLVRMAGINMGDINGLDPFDPATEWDGFPNGTFDDIGMHTSTNCDPCGSTMLTVNAMVSAPEYCEGEDVMLSESGGDMNIVSWSWTGPNGFMSTDQNPTIDMATAEASGTYTVEGFNAVGCSEISTVNVLVRQFPVVPATDPVTACIGESTLIDLSQFIGPADVSECFVLDFETPGGYTTSVPEFTDGFFDYFIRTDGSDINESIEFSNQQGSFFFAGQDLDGEGASPPLEVNIEDIDISGKSNLAFSIFLAEDQSNDGNEDWDSSDEFLIDYRIDNGIWEPLLHVQNNGAGTNSIPLIDTDFDGTGDGAEITDVFTRFYRTTIAGTGNET